MFMGLRNNLQTFQQPIRRFKMKTIKIPQVVADQIQAIRDAGKTPWVIIHEDYLVGSFSGRTDARIVKSTCQYAGQILKADDVAFEVIDLAALADKVEATIEQPVITFPLADLTEFGKNTEGLDCCPKCGSSEIYEGRAPKGIAIDEEYIFGCRHCDWEIDIRTLAPIKESEPAKKQVAHTNKSEIENPCKRVWHIADEMLISHPGAKRKQVLEACQAAGIAFYTARTQYQQWLSVRKEMAEREAQQAKK